MASGGERECDDEVGLDGGRGRDEHLGAGIAGDKNGDSCGEQYKWTPGVSDEEPCEGAFVDGASEGGIAFSLSLVLSMSLDISLSPALVLLLSVTCRLFRAI